MRRSEDAHRKDRFLYTREHCNVIATLTHIMGTRREWGKNRRTFICAHVCLHVYVGLLFFQKETKCNEAFLNFCIWSMHHVRNKFFFFADTQTLYWFCFLQLCHSQNLWVWFSQPHGTAICFPPSTLPTQKMSSSLNSQTLYWFRSQLRPQHLWVLLPSASWPNNMWALLPQPFTPKMRPPPLYPNTVLVSIPSALWLPKFMGFISLSPTAQQYVSFPLFKIKHPKCPSPSPSIRKHCIGSVSLSFETKIYGFHFKFPSAPRPNNMQVSLPSTLNTQKCASPTALNTQALL